MRPPITYYGGKQSMVKDILPLIPEHNSYVEPFVGGGAVFWAKPPSKLETLNDTNAALIRFYQILKDDPHTWAKAVDRVPYSRKLFYDYREVIRNHTAHSDLEVAVAYAVCAGQSWRRDCDTWASDAASNSMAKSWALRKKEYIKKADAYKARFDNAQIENKDALFVIESYDKPYAFIYLDPPYIETECKHYSEYTPADYEALLQTLSTIQGKFMLSCFQTDLVRDYAAQHGWVIRSFEKRMCANAKHQAKTGYKTKTELLVMNYEKVQNTLF